MLDSIAAIDVCQQLFFPVLWLALEGVVAFKGVLYGHLAAAKDAFQQDFGGKVVQVDLKF